MPFSTPIVPCFRKTIPFCRKFILTLQFHKKSLICIYKLTYTIMVATYWVLFCCYLLVLWYDTCSVSSYCGLSTPSYNININNTSICIQWPKPFMRIFQWRSYISLFWLDFFNINFSPSSLENGKQYRLFSHFLLC